LIESALIELADQIEQKLTAGLGGSVVNMKSSTASALVLSKNPLEDNHMTKLLTKTGLGLPSQEVTERIGARTKAARLREAGYRFEAELCELERQFDAKVRELSEEYESAVDELNGEG
jgi:hypothetical protein